MVLHDADPKARQRKLRRNDIAAACQSSASVGAPASHKHLEPFLQLTFVVSPASSSYNFVTNFGRGGAWNRSGLVHQCWNTFFIASLPLAAIKALTRNLKTSLGRGIRAPTPATLPELSRWALSSGSASQQIAFVLGCP